MLNTAAAVKTDAFAPIPKASGDREAWRLPKVVPERHGLALFGAAR
jgi:hypothetical protein